MNKWIVLAAAIASEVSATLALKAALDRPGWYALVAVGYIVSFILIAICLRLGMGIGVVYGIWGASGVAATAVLSALIFDEPLTILMGLGIALIIGGVLTIELGSQSAQRAAGTAAGTEALS